MNRKQHRIEGLPGFEKDEYKKRDEKLQKYRKESRELLKDVEVGDE